MNYLRRFSTLFFILFSCTVFGQTEALDTKAKTIDSLFKAKALDEKIFPQMSFCGGNLKGYYLKNELVFIHTIYSGPMGFTDTKWYLENGKLFKSVQFGFEYEEPENLDEYCKTHQTANHECDFSGLKAKTYRSIFYDYKKMISFSKVENNEPLNLTKAIQKSEMKRFKSCFKSLVEELKR
jgi:hypothetical protein